MQKGHNIVSTLHPRMHGETLRISLILNWRPRRDLNPCYRRESAARFSNWRPQVVIVLLGVTHVSFRSRPRTRRSDSVRPPSKAEQKAKYIQRAPVTMDDMELSDFGFLGPAPQRAGVGPIWVQLKHRLV